MKTRSILLRIVLGALALYYVISTLWTGWILGMIIPGKARADAWFAALAAAQPSAPRVVEFLRLFPNATVRYLYFTRTGEPGFDVKADLYDRYELCLQLPVRFDPPGHAVIGYGEPNFYLFEVARQEGGATTYVGEGQHHFFASDWQKIVASGGNFDAIGYPMITNRPVPGFKDRNVPKDP